MFAGLAAGVSTQLIQSGEHRSAAKGTTGNAPPPIYMAAVGGGQLLVGGGWWVG
jgi:hypothetical protein